MIPQREYSADFLFGTATSAYQIEEHKFGGASSTHWDSFTATPGKLAGLEHGQLACDHYHRFKEGLDLVTDLAFPVQTVR